MPTAKPPTRTGPAIILSAVGLLLCASAARAAAQPIPHGTIDLVAEKQWIAPGRTVDFGLRFQLEKGWHIYWVNPGDSGEPPRVKWDLPAGITAGSIAWPTPRRLGTTTIVDYGYEDSVTLIVPIHAAPSLPTGTPARISAEVKVLVCREMCIAGKAQLSLTVPVKSNTPAADAQTAAWFAEARKALPLPAPANWKFSATETNNSFVLTALVGNTVTSVAFFPLVESQVSNTAQQTVVSTATGFQLKLRKSDLLLKPVVRLKGVIVFSGGRAYDIDAPIRKTGAAKGSASRSPKPSA
jgi:DsbC/DsbD-like thiol-disulfide interchange protein